VIDLAMLGTASIASQLSKAYRWQTNKEKVKNNWEILSKIIGCIKFCAKFELPPHGHDDTAQLPNPGIF
jgi:hypothetical protein